MIVRRLALEVVGTAPKPSVRIDHVAVIIPEPAFRRLVASAAARAGISASGSLSDNLISVAVSVSLFRLTARFSPSVERGRLVLAPSGGLPGWLLGWAAPVVGRTPGLTMEPSGRITIDPAAFAPAGVTFRTGFTGVRVVPAGVSLTLG